MSPSPPMSPRPLPNGIQCAPVVLLPVRTWLPVDVVPEKAEVVPAVVGAMVCPGFGQSARECAKLERPDVAAVAGFPGAQVLHDACVGDAGFLGEFAQRRSPYVFAGLDAAFHQLDARPRMFERQNLSHRCIPE